MQFTITRYDYVGQPVKSRDFHGWAVSDAGDNEDEFGFTVSGENSFGGNDSIEFTIPELRQMLAEAEELRDRDAGNNSCDGSCCFAPLADEDDLSKDFEDRSSQDDTDEIESLLTRAESELLPFGNTARAKAYIELAYARKDLLG